MRHTGRSFTDFCKDITKFPEDDPEDTVKTSIRRLKQHLKTSKTASKDVYMCV